MDSNRNKPAFKSPEKNEPNLKKAKLKAAYSGEGEDLEFMFNPTEVSFTRNVRWEAPPGHRGNTLLPKVNFSGVEPYKITLKQLLFDTYETKESVMKYIEIIKKGVETVKKSPDTRPPVYILLWGEKLWGEKDFYCVITSLTYTLNMFLTNGTPVRALVDISLQEVDKDNPPGNKESSSKGRARRNSPQAKKLPN